MTMRAFIQTTYDPVSTQADPPIALIPLDPKVPKVLVGLLVGLALTVGLLPPLCLILLSATSRCSFTAQWHALVGTTPLVSIPNGATLLSDRDGNTDPLQSAGGTIQRLYGELYSTSAPPDTVVVFYRQRGAECTQKGNGTTTYWHCDVDATESGWGWVDVFSWEAYQVAPPETGVDSYHLKGPLPHDTTILRTFVNWCDDV